MDSVINTSQTFWWNNIHFEVCRMSLKLKVIVPSVTISVIIKSAGTKSAALLFSAALKAPVSAVTKAQVSAVTKAPVSAGAKAPALKRRH